MRKKISKTSPKTLERKKLRRKRFFVWFLVGIVFVIALGFVARIQSFQIRDISIVGNKVVDEEMVERNIESFLDSRYLFPRSNIVLFNKNSLIKKLQKNFLRIESIEIERPEFPNLKLTISEREPDILWCGFQPEGLDPESSPCLFADEHGFIFDDAPSFSGGVYLRYYGQHETFDDALGQQVFNKNLLKFTQEFSAELYERGFEAQAVWWQSEDQIEFLLAGTGPTTSWTKIKYYMQNNPDEILQNLDAAYLEESFRSEVLENIDQIEYIDTRFKNRVIYKEKSEDAEEIIEQVEDSEDPQEDTEE